MMRNLLLGLLILCSAITAAQVRETVSILGDSYSTFEGFITPETNEPWYFREKDAKRTDVADVTQTWWWQVVKNGGYKLGVNNSYSGATICYSGYHDGDYSSRSFITRCPMLGNPDIILVFGATNDSWANAPIGDYKYKDWVRADLYTFRPALAKLLHDLAVRYPNVKVYFMLNTGLKEDINASVLTICKYYGVPVIQLTDIDKQNGHPTIKGMKSISAQVLQVLHREK